MSGPPPASRLTFATVAAPLLERLGLLFTVTVVTALATSAVVLLQPQKYAATLVMTSVSGPRNSTLGQAFPAALLGNLGAGLQATPALITRLTTSRVVLGRVALEPLDSTDPTPAARRVRPSLPADASEHRLVRAVRRIVGVSLDRETGLVSLTVTHRDSAVARRIADRLVTEVARAFREASQAQARELRVAQEHRVDSAASQLRHAEEQLVRFLTANRVISRYSAASVEAGRRERDVSLAQSLYSQAVTDREAAIGKELEQTPAVVVLDPVPRQLEPGVRGTVVKSGLAGAAGFVLFALWLLIRDAGRSAADEAAYGARLDAALRRLRLLA